MSEIQEVPGAIEGEEIVLTGLKIAPKGAPIQIKSNIVFPVTITRRGTGEISKAYSPPKHKFKKTSMLNLADKISGRHLWGFSSSPITRKNVGKGQKGRSGRHTGQFLVITENCFAELVHGWKGDALPSHPKKTLETEDE